MKFIFDLLLAFLPSLLDPLVKMVKLEALKVYMEGIDVVRRTFILALFGVLGVMLFVGGFAMVHIALYFLLPFSPQTNALILLGAGVFYLIVPAFFLIRLCSMRNWMKVSGAEKMAAGIYGEK